MKYRKYYLNLFIMILPFVELLEVPAVTFIKPSNFLFENLRFLHIVIIFPRAGIDLYKRESFFFIGGT